MFRELIEHKISNRGTIVPAGDIFPTPSDFTRYCSLFMFGADIHAHVKAQKGVTGYKGKVYTEAIWIDIDCAEDVNAARLSAIQLVRRLNAEYQIDPDHLFIYFSGAKGFHIAIHNAFIGFTHTTAIDTEKVKDFVRRLTVGIPHVDLVIYEPVRIFRIENSRHEKTGLYKVRLSFTELEAELDDIKQLATKPRQYPFKVNYGAAKANQGLNNLWNNSGNYIQEQKEFESKGNLFQPPKEGSRNKTLLVQACTLFRKSELSSNAVLDIISNAAYIASIGTKEPIDNQELKRIVANAERLVGDERKKAVVDTIRVKSFGEWIPEWENYTLSEQTKMSMLFRDINQVLKGRLRGKLGVSMGYGGSKKSLQALNVCLTNTKETNLASIYSTMEMSVPQFMNRVIDHEVRVEGQTANASEIIAHQYKQDVNAARKFMKQLAGEMGNKLQIVPNGRMTYKHYKETVRIVKETVGEVGILVVDGLSMMGGKGTETEVYSHNTAELKELANEENIFILMICHLSKGAELYTRDASRYIRGSEKILDNCDFYMTMSQIQDDQFTDQYRKDIGFINFHDKRGSGETVNIVYNFDPLRLRLSDSDIPWQDHYEPKTKKQSKDDF